jgi:hypothetical protein
MVRSDRASEGFEERGVERASQPRKTSMKPTLLHATAVMFAIGAASIGAAPTPATPGTFAPEPIASASRTDGPDAQLSSTIVEALNAEGSLKDSKITVQIDSGVVLLTGTAQNEAQVKRASEIATASAGDAKVVNVIQPDHVEQYQKAPA